MKPTYQQSHTDLPLTNISVAYTPGQYIGTQVFPNVPVQMISGKYYIYEKGDWLRDDTGVRAPGAEGALVSGYGLSTSPYNCVERNIGAMVPDEAVDNADNPLRPLEDMTRFLTEKIFLKVEKDVQSKAFGNSVWSSSATPAVLWGNATATPIEDVETAACNIRLTIGQPALNGVMGYEVWSKLKNHPDIIDRIKYSAGPNSPAIATINAVAALMGLDSLLIGYAIENTAAEGASNSIAPVWGKHFLVYYRPPTPSLLAPAAGYVFTYQNRRVDRFRVDTRRANRIECLWSYNVYAIATDAGYLLKSVVS